MKTLVTYIALTILALTVTTGFAQTTVTGHVFAEVVESVSASQTSQSSFSIQRNQTSGIDLGQIEIKSAASATCSLILSKANFTNDSKQSFALNTSASSTQSLKGNAINGYQSISLQCQPDKAMLAQSASQYQGEVNIVLAYN